MRKRKWMLCTMAALLMCAMAAYAESSIVKLDGRGCEIPLLHAYETEYASLRAELEAISAPVGISSEKINGCVFTVDQVAASDGYLLAFFTFTSDEPFVMPQDRSIYAWHAQSGTSVFLDAWLNGNEQNEGRLSALYNNEIFFQDEHTIVGWGLLNGVFLPVRIPEVCEVTMSASPGTGFFEKLDVDTFTLDLTFTLDRSTKLPGFVEGDIDVPLVFSPPETRGVAHSVRFTHVSMSPLGNLLTMEEEVTDYAIWPTVLDERGKQLVELRRKFPMYDASPQHPVHVESYFPFVGGRGGSKLTVAPGREPRDAGETHLPLDVELPYTYTYENGQQLKILELTLDRNGMRMKYEGDYNRPLHFMYFYDKNGGQVEMDFDYDSDSRLDRSNGVRWVEMRWSPQKGAEKGERITQETFDRLQSVWISSAHIVPMMEYAVEIELPGA